MRIVIVEDEAPIRDGLSRILQKIDKNYELVGAAVNGEEGLKLIQQERPDLIILDIEMPRMDGLTMLRKLREKKIDSRAIVLTAYSDFDYARRAIELGIERYLLKPIKIAELRKALGQVEEALSRVRWAEQKISLEAVFLGAISGQLKMDEQLGEMTEKYYGFGLEERTDLLTIWLDTGYEEEKEKVKRLLDDAKEHSRDYDGCVLELEQQKAVVLILYHIKEKADVYSHFQRAVVPMLYDNIRGNAICVWGSAKGIPKIKEAMDEIWKNMAWNLSLKDRLLISQERIKELTPLPLKYSPELESKARQAALYGEKQEFEHIFQLFKASCTDETHLPEEIREASVRYFLAMYNAVKESGNIEDTYSGQAVFQAIGNSCTWEEIETAMKQFFEYAAKKLGNPEGGEFSTLVQRANKLIREYYSQGITLEEIAGRLCVSEEYLSSQFKKETGDSFTNTVRRYRLEKVKKLLLESNLKLNQIADMTGYTDPKYMSRVFKEEVGVSPAEYRKINR